MRCQAQHQLVPNRLIEWLAAAKQLIATEGLFVPVLATQARTFDRHILAVDNGVSLPASPAVGLLAFAALVATARELRDFEVHDGLHQIQARLAHQVADAILQRGGDFLERQVQLQFTLHLLGFSLKSTEVDRVGNRQFRIDRGAAFGQLLKLTAHLVCVFDRACWLLLVRLRHQHGVDFRRGLIRLQDR